MAAAGHSLARFAASVHAELDGLDVDAWGVPEGDLAPLARSLGRVLDRVSALLLGVIAEAEVRDVPLRAGATSTMAWARELLNVTPAVASKLAKTARAVRTELSATGAALAAGKVGYEQAAVIVRAVTDLPADLDLREDDGPGIRGLAEAHLLGEAARLDAGQLARVGQHLLTIVAPQIGEAREADALARQEARDRERRELSWSADPWGGMWVSGHMDGEDAQIVRAALDPLCAPHPVDGQRDPRSPGRRRADALVEVCRRALSRGDLPAAGGEPPQVVVHIPLRTLYDGLGPASYHDGTRISPGLARRWACDAKIIPTVLGSASAVLDLGRAARLFTGARRRAIVLRDHGCTFPGCDRPAAWCQVHHILGWWHGGRTDRTNGALACDVHHDVLHKGDWKVVLAADGIPEYIPPPWVDPEQRPRRNTRHG